MGATGRRFCGKFATEIKIGDAGRGVAIASLSLHQVNGGWLAGFFAGAQG
jgi:hypothetical protein